MSIAEQLDAASGTNRLVLVEFYADWSPHYEWLEPVVRTYEKQVSEVVKVNIVGDKAVADSFNIETAPAFSFCSVDTNCGGKWENRPSLNLNWCWKSSNSKVPIMSFCIFYPM